MAFRLEILWMDHVNVMNYQLKSDFATISNKNLIYAVKRLIIKVKFIHLSHKKTVLGSSWISYNLTSGDFTYLMIQIV